MRKLKIILLSLALMAALGCAARSYKVYGASGKLYQAPELCQAVADCAKSDEKGCYYPQSNDYNCGTLVP